MKKVKSIEERAKELALDVRKIAREIADFNKSLDKSGRELFRKWWILTHRYGGVSLSITDENDVLISFDFISWGEKPLYVDAGNAESIMRYVRHDLDCYGEKSKEIFFESRMDYVWNLFNVFRTGLKEKMFRAQYPEIAKEVDYLKTKVYVYESAI